jgi:integrase
MDSHSEQSERLGHANVSITLDTYSHVAPGLEQDVADVVAQLVDGDSRCCLGFRS